MIEIVAPGDVDRIWPLIREWFVQALERCGDDLTAGQIWQAARSGSVFLIVAHDGAKITAATVVKFETWGNGLVLRIVGIGGADMDQWKDDMQAFLSTMARDHGASRIVTEGRDGWSRLFPQARKLRSTYVMEI